MSTTTNPNTHFLDHLRKVADDRGKRAALRRYWSPATRHQAYPVLGELRALDDKRKTLIATLYAEHPEHSPRVGIGAAARQLGKPKDGEHPYERHFRRLLACESTNDLGQQLHRLFKRLSREAIGLDYEDLHKRLNFWTNYREEVKVRWAAEFWQAPIPSTNESIIKTDSET
jgi:CRISPR type I-E-associated protein CasB/Cse2